MEPAELLRSLGSRIGIELLPDADGACAIEADGIAVTFTALPELSSIVLHCRVLDGDAFFAETERFVNTVEAWTRSFSTFQP